MRVVVDADGRLVSVAYSNRALQPGERVKDVTPAEYERLASGDFAWVNNAEQLVDATRVRNALQANADFLANQSPTQAQIWAQVRLLTRAVGTLMRLVIAAKLPFLLDDISDT